MESRIKIKMGTIEVEYEGESAFIKKDLLLLIKQLAEQLKASGLSVDTAPHGVGAKGIKQLFSGLTTLSIAKSLNYKSCPELIMAAATKLTFVDRTEPFSRKMLLEEMKLAKGLYKESYNNNMSQALERLVGNGKLLKAGKDKYNIADQVKAELEADFAKH